MNTQSAPSTPKINRTFGSLTTMQQKISTYLWEEIFSRRVIKLLNPDDITSYREILDANFDLED